MEGPKRGESNVQHWEMVNAQSAVKRAMDFNDAIDEQLVFYEEVEEPKSKLEEI